MQTDLHYGDDAEAIIKLYCKKWGYDDIEDWARDSDYRCNEVSSEWYSIDDYGPNANPVDIKGCFFGAIETSGELEELQKELGNV